MQAFILHLYCKIWLNFFSSFWGPISTTAPTDGEIWHGGPMPNFTSITAARYFCEVKNRKIAQPPQTDLNTAAGALHNDNACGNEGCMIPA